MYGDWVGWGGAAPEPGFPPVPTFSEDPWSKDLLGDRPRQVRMMSRLTARLVWMRGRQPGGALNRQNRNLTEIRISRR
jgi:hypothetical protein